MKVKLDFITNSSTSSFVVWGIEIEKYKILEKHPDLVHSLFERFKSINKDEDFSNMTIEEFIDEYNFNDCMYERAAQFDLDCHNDDDGTFSIGMSPFEMDELITLRKYKEKIASALTLFLGKDVNIKNIQKIEIAEANY